MTDLDPNSAAVPNYDDLKRRLAYSFPPIDHSERQRKEAIAAIIALETSLAERICQERVAAALGEKECG